MRSVIDILRREMVLLRQNPIFPISIVFLPILVTAFFTSFLDEGQPQEMPVGIVDQDNTSMTRTLVRRLDDFQTSNVVAHYPSVSDARRAIQHGEICAFLYFPKGTTSDLIAQRQPKVSFYYSSTTLIAGQLLMRDLKTITTLGSAAVGQSTLLAKGFTDAQAQTFLQPLGLDVHLIGNPWVSYNMYLSAMMVPGCVLLFVMLLTAYTLGMEMKNETAKELLDMAGGNVWKAVYVKLFPQTVAFTIVLLGILVYMFYWLNFAHVGGFALMLVLAILAILAAQGFGIMCTALIPNMRMAMSISSLWGVLSFSVMGTAYPIQGMDAPLQSLAYLFPLRHYFLIYAENIFNGYPLYATAINFGCMLLFIFIPALLVPLIGRNYREYKYEL